MHAMEYRIRDPEYTKAFPADQADVRIAALMMWFRMWMPASWMPITNGDAAAFELGDSKRLLLRGTMTPMASEPRP